ncbi:hypothetical protein [Flavobacterium sp. N3904]|uniref:hypothetical protein n=1 Tax=Flavobacterium sp. N3904 TaxID=2986835 RepID=UPI0022247F43|nr:hypothetical protein [Flavobacterium sp. N3904]
MNNFTKSIFSLCLFLLINPVFSQVNDETSKANPMLELLGSNAKTLGLKGNVKEMQEQKFSLDAKGKKIVDSVLSNNIYKFDKDGLTKEFEQNYSNTQSKKYFFSYTNKGYISHIDIETTDLSKNKDTSDTYLTNQYLAAVFSTVDYKYVKKKNILYKGEDQTEGKKNIRNEYFYHFNDDNQIVQIDYQSTDLTTKYIYDSNGLIKEIYSLKSGIITNKAVCKYEKNILINILTISTDNKTKLPNNETVINYKFDTKGNITEKKIVSYLYSPNGNKEFLEGNLYQYDYIY